MDNDKSIVIKENNTAKVYHIRNNHEYVNLYYFIKIVI